MITMRNKNQQVVAVLDLKEYLALTPSQIIAILEGDAKGDAK